MLRDRHSDRSFEGIGVSVPGRVHPETQRFLLTPNLHWKDFDVRTALQKALKLQVEMDNLFDLARYATNDKNRERLGMMMQDLERQQREAEGAQFDLADIEEEQAKIEAEIVRFETWVAKVRPNLTNPQYMETASYEELRLAVRVLGIVVTVSPLQGASDRKDRCDIKVTVPAVLGKIEKSSGVNEPTFRSPVAGLPLRHWK